MAKTDSKVMAFVEAELERNPTIEVKDLFEMVKEEHRSVRSLDLRQFNARYPLQVKRRKGGGRRRRRRPATERAAARSQTNGNGSAVTNGNGGRDAVRTTLLSFATDVTAAEDKKELVEVLAGVDRYVDEVWKATRK